ncbi:hypothetical protein DLE01_09455, partial [Streptomyces sp. FT05W]
MATMLPRAARPRRRTAGDSRGCPGRSAARPHYFPGSSPHPVLQDDAPTGAGELLCRSCGGTSTGGQCWTQRARRRWGPGSTGWTPNRREAERGPLSRRRTRRTASTN